MSIFTYARVSLRKRPSYSSRQLWHQRSLHGSDLLLLANTSSVCFSSFIVSLKLVSSFSLQAHTSGDQLVVSTITSCITHSFQVANWGLPLAALADLSKDEEVISGSMTTALGAYSYVPFHSHAAACSPTNTEWFSCALVRSVMIF